MNNKNNKIYKTKRIPHMLMLTKGLSIHNNRYELLVEKLERLFNEKGIKNTNISVRGRHDPCVGIRAVPIGEAMLHCVILDHYLMNKAQNKV